MGYLSIIILFPRKDTFSGGFCPSMSGLKVKITRVAQNSIFISSRNTKFERNYFLIRKILMENSGNIKLINTWKFRENPKSKQFRTHPKNAPTGQRLVCTLLTDLLSDIFPTVLQMFTPTPKEPLNMFFCRIS